MTEPRDSMSAEDRQLWEAASPVDRARSEKTLADLIEEDRNDPNTPDHFDVDLVPLEEVEQRASGPAGRMGISGNSYNINRILVAANLLRSWGWTVVFMEGWETRGADRRQLIVQYIGDHHTAAAVDVDRILRDGRSDVPGPLCEVGVHADSTIVIVAAGPANHFGVATIDSSDALGVENTGPIPTGASGKTAFPNYQATLAVYVAFRRVYGLNENRIVLHKETARPEGRKIDRAVDGDTVRREAAVTEVLKEDDMPTIEEIENVMRRVLNEGTATGQPSWAATNKAILGSIQGTVNLVNSQTSALARSITDARTAVVAEIHAIPTSHFSPEEQAEMVTQISAKVAELGLDVDENAIAEAVANDLAERIAS